MKLLRRNFAPHASKEPLAAASEAHPTRREEVRPADTDLGRASEMCRYHDTNHTIYGLGFRVAE